MAGTTADHRTEHLRREIEQTRTDLAADVAAHAARADLRSGATDAGRPAMSGAGEP